MSADALAGRLRQAVQGCTVHLHGPVQAFQAVRAAHNAGEVDEREVANLAIHDCNLRLLSLAEEGVAAQDARVRKERATIEFIQALFGLREEA